MYDPSEESLLNVRRTVAPTIEPITLTELKDHLRIDHSAEDNVLEGLGRAAREWVEQFTRRALVTQTWQMTLPGFARYRLRLWPCPVIAITSITYIDQTGATVTLAASEYQLDTTQEPAILSPKFGGAWPSARWQPGSVKITYTAGYGSTRDAVPETLKLGIKQLAGGWYEYRESVAEKAPSEVPQSLLWHLMPERVEGIE